MIGGSLTVVSVPSQIYQITGSSAYVGLTGVFGLVPLIIFGLWGGALADVMDRRILLLISTSGLIATSALFWVQAALGVNNVWLLLGIFSAQQAFFGVNSPTRTAILPKIIPLHELPAANALNTTVFQAGSIVGPVIGGALIPVLGYSWLYLVDTICLFTTLWAIIKLPPIRPHREPGAPKPVAGIRSVLDGFGYLRGHPVLLMSFVVDLIAMIFGMPRTLFPQIAHQSFGGSDGGGLAFALLFAAISAGAVVGGVFSGWITRVRRQGLAVVVCIVVWGAAIAAFGGVLVFAHGTTLPILPIAVLLLMIGGAADMVSSAFRQSMLQSAASDDVRGRLQGVFTVVVAGGPRIADVVHGGGAATVGTVATTAGGGILVVVLVIVAALAVPAFVRYRVATVPRKTG